MAEGSCHIKQEIDTTCCSPTTSLTMQKKSSHSSSCIKANNIVTSNCNGHNYTVQEVILKSSPSVSPERQLCSSTTSVSGDMVCATSDGKMNATGNGSAGLVMRDELRRLCLVCGDVASGFHYGVASCEACKAFFKRTIQGNIEYTCPANNECEINKRRRKACQACRFQKCLLMGMLKEGVRLDRVRGGRQKYRRNPVSNTYQTMQMLFQSSTSSLDDIKILEVLNTYEPDAISTQNDGGGGGVGGGGGTNLNVSSTATDEMDTAKTGSSSSSSSKSCMFNIKTCYADPHDILSVISDIYDKELVGVIGWAKQIPGFTDLILDDQMKLLQVSWAEILTLQLTYRSVPFNGRLHFATDVWMDEAIAQECGATEFYYHCVKIAQRLERLSARKEEYYLLKALALSNCDIQLEDQSSLRIFRDSIMNSLNDCVYLLRHSAAVSHQQQLLLLLPALRQADNILRRFWRNVFREGIVTMKKLFIEMLDTPLR